ncbi:MAG TPA: PQQ-binding-like beta-propeller repeat protein [Pyrinomonadaceae bacterium]|nr:PQQ-binding-like beta-propeller repeat protein [Pyrinomonadaceae bacterium]
MFSTPTVAGDSLFIGSCAGTFYAINKTTGQVQWSYDIRKDGKQISFHGDPLVTDDLILIGTDYSCAPDGIGHVYAFERSSGKVRWKYRSTSVPTDIVQLGSNVYFGSFQDKWSSVNLQTGGLNWSFSTDTPNPDCAPIKSPVAVERRLFFAGLDGVVYSLDAASGRVMWKRKLAAAPSTSLVFRDKTLYVGTADQHIYRLNAETGAIVAELAIEATPTGRPAFAADSLYVFLENRPERAGYIISVDTKLAGVRWKQKSSPEWTSRRSLLWKGYVVAGNCRGEVAAFRASDGEPQWKLNVKGCISSIGSSGDILFVGVQEGTVYAFDLSAKP